ncbi:MAG TPA: zf-HC2 domain-containing protein [Vicinamibacterales bacterium]
MSRNPSARCRALAAELSRYLDGDLSASRRRAIERHIEACTCCGWLASRLRTVMALCRNERGRPMPRAVRARAAARLRRLLADEK